MNSQSRILLIDNAVDRKERINALKARGYAVFPALRMEEARSRCMRGSYDLIVVNSGDKPEQALEFCDDIRENCPKQLLLLSSSNGVGREYAVASDLQSLVQAVDRIFQANTNPADFASAA
jgi:DNA-binding response OmpR family regulator